LLGIARPAFADGALPDENALLMALAMVVILSIAALLGVVLFIRWGLGALRRREDDAEAPVAPRARVVRRNRKS
jgi:hypothetical protein